MVRSERIAATGVARQLPAEEFKSSSGNASRMIVDQEQEEVAVQASAHRDQPRCWLQTLRPGSRASGRDLRGFRRRSEVWPEGARARGICIHIRLRLQLKRVQREESSLQGESRSNGRGSLA